MNLVDLHCLELFPEMKEQFQALDLERASDEGSYIFHEDYFLRFALDQNENKMLKRIADYIEELACSENKQIRNLAQIGVLEGMINSNFTKIAKHLGQNSKSMVGLAEKRLMFKKSDWL